MQFWAMAFVGIVSAAAVAQPERTRTDLDDRSDVAVTIYNNGLGLIRDTRTVALPTGESELEFGGVAEQIIPESVSLRSLSAADSLVVYEQNYEYDLINAQKLMEKYVGREITLLSRGEDFRTETQTATLLSYTNGPVYEIDGQIYLGHPGSPILPEIPDNLIAKPSLVWTLGNSAGSQELEATYLTNGISWKADYVVSIARDADTLDLSGWVTLDNQSGAEYGNALLKLVAGDVNRVSRAKVQYDMGMPMAARAMAESAPMPTEEAFAEYHLYTMPRRTTIKQNQSKQLALLDAEGVAFEKVYKLRGSQGYYYGRMGVLEDMRPDVVLEFENEEANGLGIPIPMGVVRVYEEDRTGVPQFAGEDRVDHMPKDETIEVRMGQAFDIVADRTQTDWKEVSRSIVRTVYESAFEINIRNKKDEDVVVLVSEPFSDNWEVLEHSQAFEKRSAFEIVFPVPVPADGETTLAFRFRTFPQ